MPSLYQTFLKHDLGHLRIVADLWGLELESQDLDSAAEELSASLLDLEAVTETIDILSPESRAALDAIVESNGKMEWAAFTRAHGEIRGMGAAKRDRERPHLKPISPAEHLFYRGILARAFFESSKGSQEFAYIPDDLLEVIEMLVVEDDEAPTPAPHGEPLGRPATPVEKAVELPATDHILDDATTYLAALRIGSRTAEGVSTRRRELHELLEAAHLIKDDALQPEAVKNFLGASRAEALNILYKAWFVSNTFDELRLLPGILCEGEWSNQPQVTREFLTNLINDIPQNKWWSLPALLRDIKTKYPDFQRPAGDYDSWFIKRESDGQYLRGFAYWDQVDGALIKYFVQTLHWLGRVNLAAPEEGKESTAFFLLSSFVERNEEKGKIVVSSNGKITISRYFSRAVRYQIARFCEWDEEKGNEYFYRVTAGSLKHANEQGLKSEQLLALLVKYTNGNVSPALVKALKRWDTSGVEARVESLLLLRVSRPEIMEEIRKSKAGKYLGEVLSPTAVIVKSGAIQKVMAELAELGLLAEVTTHE